MKESMETINMNTAGCWEGGARGEVHSGASVAWAVASVEARL